VKKTAPLIALSERIYCALLYAYPADYRRDYGALMAQVYRDVARDAYRDGGWAGMVIWWLTTMFDLLVTAFEQRRKPSFTMSKSNFAQLAGTLLIIGGALIALASFSQLQPDDHYSYYGIYQVLIWFVAPGFFLLGIGSISLGLRYEQALGKLGLWSLYVAGIGALIASVGVVATSIQESLWDIWYVGGVIHVAALTLFGLAHVMKPALPIFRGLPLQIAGGWLITMLGVLRTESQTTNNLISFLIFFGMGLAWLAIGIAVNRQNKAAILAPA
jgi:hypothetical protein